MIVGLGEVVKDGLSLEIERGAVSLEHGFFRGPSPSLAPLPLGLLDAGHDTSRNPLQSLVLDLHEVDSS